MDVFDPFIVFTEHPDFDASDARKASEAELQRNDAIQQHLRGEMSSSDLFDLLDQQGIDPLTFATVATENMNYIVDNGIVFESNDSGLFLPQHIIN